MIGQSFYTARFDWLKGAETTKCSVSSERNGYSRRNLMARNDSYCNKEPDRTQFAFLSSYLDTKSCVTWMTVVVIQGPKSALLDKSDYRLENYSYVISIALEWHEAIKNMP